MKQKEKRERPWKHQWLDLVEEVSCLPASTRHLLLSLGRRMRSDGSSCYPGTRTIAARTGLSERTVCTHLTLAENKGWLKRLTRGPAAGRAWRGHEYRPAVPTDVLKEIQCPIASGAEGDSVPQPLGTEPHDAGVLKEVQSSSPNSSSTTLEAISAQRSRYSSEQLEVIDEAIDAFRSTRKTNRIADSVILTEFRWWKDRPVNHVVEGLGTYVCKGYTTEGKNEKYARGIIRNLKAARGTRNQPPKRAGFLEMENSKAEYLTARRAQSEELSR